MSILNRRASTVGVKEVEFDGDAVGVVNEQLAQGKVGDFASLEVEIPFLETRFETVDVTASKRDVIDGPGAARDFAFLAVLGIATFEFLVADVNDRTIFEIKPEAGKPEIGSGTLFQSEDLAVERARAFEIRSVDEVVVESIEWHVLLLTFVSDRWSFGPAAKRRDSISFLYLDAGLSHDRRARENGCLRSCDGVATVYKGLARRLSINSARTDGSNDRDETQRRAESHRRTPRQAIGKKSAGHRTRRAVGRVALGRVDALTYAALQYTRPFSASGRASSSKKRGIRLLYQLYELTHAAVAPWRTAAHLGRLMLNNPANPLSYTYPAKAASATLEVFEGLTRQYGKPEFGIETINVNGARVAIDEVEVMKRPFCRLKRFRRADLELKKRPVPKLLIVAPLSGHYATLLHGTVKAMLEYCDVTITDWTDAREVPLHEGAFDLDDYIDYVLDFMRRLGPDLHVLAVCQPGPAVLAATALLAADDDPMQPATVTLMGSPIDARKSPTQPNDLAASKSLSWFERNVIMQVPFPNPGVMRRVYPGFLQLTGFMTMNLDRHLSAHQTLFQNLVAGDGDSVAGHHKFYDEYLAVMDLPAEYYLQTLHVVFQEYQLAEGAMTHRGRKVDLGQIKHTALMTVEGENDDISGIGQTQAAHDLCINIPDHMRVDYIQPDVGHYGVFNGSRWRAEIAPRIRDFICSFA